MIRHDNAYRSKWRTPKYYGIYAVVTLIGLLAWNLWSIDQHFSNNSSDDHFVLSSRNIIFEIGSGTFIALTPIKRLKSTAEIKVVLDDKSIVDTIASFTVKAGSKTPIFIPLHTRKTAGHCVLSLTSKSDELKNLFKIRVKVKVVHSLFFGYLTIALGWAYFICWSVCYYPQVYKNFKRKSVVGLSFDYLALNVTGHICFFMFNITMYHNSVIQLNYHNLHPKGALPVKYQDTYFSIHALIMNGLLLLQCLFYEIGDQKLSMPMITLVCGLWASVFTVLLAGICEKITWLQLIYFLSYIKVTTTPIKYTPQVYLNYVTKSTEGWSIHTVFLDLCGGIMVLLQMLIDAVNNDDWDGTYGNPSKLGLGIIAIIFCAVFCFQHFALYRSNAKRHLIKFEKDNDSICFSSKSIDHLKKPFSRSPSLSKLLDM